jgi:hypothetical protein
VTVTLTNGHKLEGYINPDYDELSIELVTNPGGDTIYIAVSHIVSILRKPRRVPTDVDWYPFTSPRTHTNALKLRAFLVSNHMLSKSRV